MERSDGQTSSGANRDDHGPTDWVWDQYWHADRIASCFDESGARNYDERIAASWRLFFQSLAPGSLVLDLCTGNGAIALLAAESGRDLDIVAVDRADIDPRRYVSRSRESYARIDFQPRIAVEHLPFEEGRFGAVVSQYGIEYSNLVRSVPEAARVLAPGGRIRLILHAAEGSVVATSRKTLPEVAFLLEELDLVGAALACFRAVLAAERNPLAGPQFKQDARAELVRFETAMKRAGEHIPQAADPAMVRNAGATLIDLFNRRANYSPVELEAQARKVETELRAHGGRLEQLVAAAVTAEQASSLCEALRAEGLAEARMAELRVESYLVGHVIEGSR